MRRYRMEDGKVVSPQTATAVWEEKARWDGSNYISVGTGSQWEHQMLYRSRRGRYWLECWSDWQGSTPSAEWLSPQAAAQWLLMSEHDLPADLAELDAEVAE